MSVSIHQVGQAPAFIIIFTLHFTCYAIESDSYAIYVIFLSFSVVLETAEYRLHHHDSSFRLNLVIFWQLYLKKTKELVSFLNTV